MEFPVESNKPINMLNGFVRVAGTEERCECPGSSTTNEFVAQCEAIVTIAHVWDYVVKLAELSGETRRNAYSGQGLPPTREGTPRGNQCRMVES
jgi:hypothetical protein